MVTGGYEAQRLPLVSTLTQTSPGECGTPVGGKDTAAPPAHPQRSQELLQVQRPAAVAVPAPAHALHLSCVQHQPQLSQAPLELPHIQGAAPILVQAAKKSGHTLDARGPSGQALGSELLHGGVHSIHAGSGLSGWLDRLEIWGSCSATRLQTGCLDLSWSPGGCSACLLPVLPRAGSASC